MKRSSEAMQEPLLQTRDREILRAVVDSFLQTGEPVGSRTVSREHAEALSPATIRNVMSDLEASGLLTQPHPSAGRVPTERGLRFYVGELLEARGLTDEEWICIRRDLALSRHEPAGFLEKSSRILAELSHHVGIVLVPDLSHRIVEQVTFLRIDARRVAAMIVTRPGLVDHRVIEVESDFPQDELDRVARFINESFHAQTLQGIRTRLIAMMGEEKALYDHLMREALELSARVFSPDATQGELIAAGTHHILDSEGFESATRMKALFQAFEEKSRLVSLLSRCLDDPGSKVLIGTETGTTGMESCALVTSPYGDGTRAIGSVAILGPTRMQYAHAIALVEALSSHLTEYLSGSAQGPFGASGGEAVS